MIQLPPATPKPCNDCPWRREATPGWLGPYNAEQWVELAHSEEPIACHLTIPEGPDEREAREKWEDTPGLRQCAGVAIFRNNVFKSSRNSSAADHEFEADTEAVFGTNDEFIEHHEDWE